MDTTRVSAWMELSAEFYWEQDASHRFTFLSPGFHGVTGIAPEAWLGRSLPELTRSPHDDASWQTHLGRLRALQPFRDVLVEVSQPVPSPRTMVFRGRARFSEAGRFIGYAGVGHDATAAARSEEARLYAVLDGLPAVIAHWGPDLRCEFVNRMHVEWYGLSRREMLGRHVSEFLPAAVYEEIKPRIDAVMRGIPQQFEGTRQAASGSPRRVSASYIPDIVLGEQRGFFVLVTDVTDLSTLVEQRTEQLREAKEHAEAANAAKSDFLANMSHEMRTPMHAILSFSSMGLQKAVADEVDHMRMHGYFTRIDQSARRLMRLLNDLLDLARLESRQLEYEFGRHDIGILVQGMIDESALIARDRGITLNLETCLPLHRAWCDPRRVEQVMRNLITNAIKFSADGGAIVIRLEDSALPAAPHGDGPRPACLITVADQGVGIPDGELDGIFDKFVQSSRTRTGAGGTGLGLAIARELVQQHAGRIWAAHRTGGGTVMSVLLPAEAAPDATPDPSDRA